MIEYEQKYSIIQFKNQNVEYLHDNDQNAFITIKTSFFTF